MAADERVQTFRMTDDLHARVTAYADDNSMSFSEAMREILGVYARGEVTPPERQRRSRRVAVWIDPSDWIRFTNRAANDGVAISDAIEAAVKENT